MLVRERRLFQFLDVSVIETGSSYEGQECKEVQGGIECLDAKLSCLIKRLGRGINSHAEVSR